MDEMRVGVVITAGADRQENVELCLAYLDDMNARPERVMLVLDGHDQRPAPRHYDLDLRIAQVPKHRPGMEQPRNAGVRMLLNLEPELTHAWFVDSDIIVGAHALAHFKMIYGRVRDVTRYDPILIGPYDWMAPGMREMHDDLFTDQRWEMFRERGHRVAVAELGVALGNFGGNLMWPISEFMRVGGFHPMLHHGRCEDGELGLRAAAHRVPMVLVPEARGWHLWHEVNMEAAVQRNTRDVPLINQWHPWVEEKGLIVTDQDGARFDFACSCGEQINTLEMWEHLAHHNGVPQPDLILPEGM